MSLQQQQQHRQQHRQQQHQQQHRQQHRQQQHYHQHQHHQHQQQHHNGYENYFFICLHCFYNAKHIVLFIIGFWYPQKKPVSYCCCGC